MNNNLNILHRYTIFHLLGIAIWSFWGPEKERKSLCSDFSRWDGWRCMAQNIPS